MGIIPQNDLKKRKNAILCLSFQLNPQCHLQNKPI